MCWIGTTCASPTGATYTASYDAWGNVTSRTYTGTTVTLTYDVLDHLVAWNAGSTNQEWYAYDASGNRVLRRSTTSSGTSITTYAFGLEEHFYGATGINTGNTFYYRLGGRLIGTLTGITTLTPQFFLTDALGSVLATFSATAGSAAVLGNQVYGPYGNQRYTQGSMGTAKGYTGQYADATGLDYYNARYYDPIVGRFVSADTVQGNEQGMDPYAYVMGNPETMNDPTGQWMQFAVAIGSIAGLLVGACITGPVGVIFLAIALVGAVKGLDNAVQQARDNRNISLEQGLDEYGKAVLQGEYEGAIDKIPGISSIVNYGCDIVTGKTPDEWINNWQINDPNPSQDKPTVHPVTPRQDGPVVHPKDINTITIKAQSMIQPRGNAGGLTRAGVKKASSSVSKKTYTYTSTRSSSSWKQTSAQGNYSYTSSVYHYTGANSIYDYSTFSASNGYYQKNIGGIRMS